MGWNETIQEMISESLKPLPAQRYAELMKPKFTIAHKFDGDECFQLWTMTFESAAEAAAWIKQNHPNSIINGNEWVILQYPTGVMM